MMRTLKTFKMFQHHLLLFFENHKSFLCRQIRITLLRMLARKGEEMICEIRMEKFFDDPTIEIDQGNDFWKLDFFIISILYGNKCRNNGITTEVIQLMSVEMIHLANTRISESIHLLFKFEKVVKSFSGVLMLSNINILDCRNLIYRNEDFKSDIN